MYSYKNMIDFISCLAWVVQRLDSAVHWINGYPGDKCSQNYYVSWIAIYSVGSAIQPLNNKGLVI